MKLTNKEKYEATVRAIEAISNKAYKYYDVLDTSELTKKQCENLQELIWRAENNLMAVLDKIESRKKELYEIKCKKKRDKINDQEAKMAGFENYAESLVYFQNNKKSQEEINQMYAEMFDTM